MLLCWGRVMPVRGEQCSGSGGEDRVTRDVLECLAMWSTRGIEGCLTIPACACAWWGGYSESGDHFENTSIWVDCMSCLLCPSIVCWKTSVRCLFQCKSQSFCKLVRSLWERGGSEPRLSPQCHCERGSTEDRCHCELIVGTGDCVCQSRGSNLFWESGTE